MEFTDYLWWKLGVFVLAAGVYGFLKGWREGRARRARRDAGFPD